ncbi:hypothetical protein ACFT1A_29400 [Rhodococcus sp. NPDC057135]
MLWTPGEMHESGSDDGKLFTITQSSAPFAGQHEIAVDATKAIEEAP